MLLAKLLLLDPSFAIIMFLPLDDGFLCLNKIKRTQRAHVHGAKKIREVFTSKFFERNRLPHAYHKR